ncbi:putative cytochrome p450 monooxygenase protein [Botrytis fragariae]|uniref:Putative cytochrome p450 monooxygenase protein n=1 Tax=Botrytis fragariae TaxID=1964551 RepID=A0A8H6B0W1_9HELO|nr:putative cytochrome p450 monooxygenase protein [Botrytis fragariae]KAF5877070.1 putative cytochrome p450 monooxygenase protein [Botrytis fragariae]
MAPLVLTLVVLLPVTFAIWNLVCLVKNYRIALTIGIPIRILVASGDNPVWILASGIVFPIVKAVFGDCDIVRYSKPGWEFKDKYTMHQKLSNAVIHVSAGRNWLYLCDTDSVNEVFKHKDDFDRPPDLLAVLSVFGPNISKAAGPDWQRQRKITSAPSNDKNTRLVWIEGLRQADEILQFWKSLKGPITRTDKDTRTFSLHLETVRLYNPLIGICKSTFERPQPLTVDGRTISIPPGTRIIANSNALHSHPRYWGNNSLEWHPQSWILTKAENTHSSPIEREYVRVPPKRSYQPWSDSIRACPGKKSSQVEFVAAMVSLFKRNRVEIVREEGEIEEEAKKRVMSVVKDNVIVLLLQMRSPEKVSVRWVSGV